MSYEFKFKTKPYDHQVAAIKKGYGHDFFALFMEQGTGKSKVAIDVAANLFLEGRINAVLLIAPNGVQRQWAYEQIPTHCSVPFKIQVWKNGGGRLRERLQEEFIIGEFKALKWFCVNVDTFSTMNHIRTFKEFLLNHQALVVVDESTRIKNPSANRTTNILYNLAKIVKQGKKVVDVQPYSKYRMILTGMMVTNSPYDLWAMFEFLKHNYFKGNIFAFRAHYGIEVSDTNLGTGRTFRRFIRPDEIKSIRRYSEEGKSVETIAAIMSTTESNVSHILNNPTISSPFKNLDELRSIIQRDSFIIRKEECLDLPPKVYERIEVELNSEQKRIYKELVREFMSKYDEKELTVENKVSLIGRLQQVTGGFFPYTDADGRGKIVQITTNNPKLDALKDDLDETGKEPIIIWARFVAELKLIHTQLVKAFPERNVQLYYGGTQDNEREKIIRDFQHGDVDVLVANATTAGTGLNLQKAHLMYFYSNSFSLEDRLQAESRIDRSGQVHSMLFKDLIVMGTVDEKVHQVLETKKSLLDYFRESSLKDLIGG